MAITGFLAGGFILTTLMGRLGIGYDVFPWAFHIIGGLIGVVLVLLLFDWALITFSSIAGAALILQSFSSETTAGGLIFILLVVTGITLQGFLLPQVIFVNSMSDLFHKDVPFEFIEKAFDVMKRAYWHQFQVLTKRAERLAELSPYLQWTDNIWMGVSVENEKYKFRIDCLRQTGAKVKFLSLKPLIGPLGELNLKKINWVIVGGESGPGARPIMQDWVTDIRDQCLGAKVPFFLKQWAVCRRKR